MQTDIRGLKIYDVSKEEVVELAMITYKSSGISIYLPKRICNVLQLEDNVNSSLIVVAMDNNCMLMICFKI